MSADETTAQTDSGQPTTDSPDAPDSPATRSSGVSIRTERILDPETRVRESWQLDDNATNTVALCHLPSMVDRADSPLTAPIGRYSTSYLREWAELLQMLGISMVSIHALQRADDNEDRALVGVPDDSHTGNVVPAVAPRPGNTEDCARILPPEDAGGSTPESLAEADAQVVDRWVDVEVSPDGLEVELAQKRGDGTTEVVDGLSLPEDDVETSDGAASIQLRFDGRGDGGGPAGRSRGGGE